MRYQRSTFVMGLIISVIVLGQWYCKPGNSKAETFEYLNLHDSVEYIGMGTCAQCHTEKHSTFLHTGMGSSFALASPEISSARFEHAHVFDSSTNLHYIPFFKEENLYILEFELNNGDTIFQRTEKVDYIVGSGQHTNSHLMLRNGFIVQAPLTWYTQEAKWDLPPGFEEGANSRFTRIINSECMSCHNSLPTMKKGSNRQFIKVGEGIDCERCHGPGELHLKYRQSVGLNPQPGRDSTIVNPANLSSQLLIDLCQRCHLQGNNVLKEGREFSDFKPGMKLSDVFEVYLPDYKGDKSKFNMADHSQRLQMSQCYIQSEDSENSLNCISCHNPHVSVKQTKAEVFNSKCQSCHIEKQCSLPLEDRQASNNSCFSCHMPLSEAKDIPHVRIHDHRIQIPDSLEKEEEFELIGLYSVNNPKPDAIMQIKAYLSYYEKFDSRKLYLQKAKGLLAKNENTEQAIHLHFLEKNWAQVIQLADAFDGEFQDAFTAYRISKAYSQKNDYTQAASYLSQAIILEPYRFEFKNELGVVYIKQKKYQKAIDILEKCVEDYPFYAKSFNNLGYALFLSGNNVAALSNFQKAIQLDNHYSSAYENIALLYLSSNQKQRALEYLYKALKYSDDQARLKKAIERIKKE